MWPQLVDAWEMALHETPSAKPQENQRKATKGHDETKNAEDQEVACITQRTSDVKSSSQKHP